MDLYDCKVLKFRMKQYNINSSDKTRVHIEIPKVTTTKKQRGIILKANK